MAAKKKKFGRSHPVMYIITLVIASVLLILIAAPVPFLVTIMEFNMIFGYLTIAVAGLMMGFLTCVLVEHFTVKEKNEIIAGVIVPLPASIALYAGFALLNKMKQMFVSVESDLAIANLFSYISYPPALATAIVFIFFNVPFIYYFYKKHEDTLLLFYYMIAPVVITAGAIIVNTVLLIIMGG